MLGTVRCTTVCTSAAFGEYVPANPPLSFHATSWSGPPLVLTEMPRSWFNPAPDVQRSALPLRIASESWVGVKLSFRAVASTSVQATPLLPPRHGCNVVLAE